MLIKTEIKLRLPAIIFDIMKDIIHISLLNSIIIIEGFFSSCFTFTVLYIGPAQLSTQVPSLISSTHNIVSTTSPIPPVTSHTPPTTTTTMQQAPSTTMTATTEAKTTTAVATTTTTASFDYCDVAKQLCQTNCPDGYLVDPADCTFCICKKDALSG
jgi:hypothetical protein